MLIFLTILGFYILELVLNITLDILNFLIELL